MLSYIYYPEGGFFKRHRDAPLSIWASPYRECRELSFLLYLDAGWKEEWGGALRIYRRDSRLWPDDRSEPHVDVMPEAGTLVVMRSSQVEHEVLETLRPRHAAVGWFCAVVEDGRVQPGRPLWPDT